MVHTGKKEATNADSTMARAEVLLILTMIQLRVHPPRPRLTSATQTAAIQLCSPRAAPLPADLWRSRPRRLRQRAPRPPSSQKGRHPYPPPTQPIHPSRPPRCTPTSRPRKRHCGAGSKQVTSAEGFLSCQRASSAAAAVPPTERRARTPARGGPPRPSSGRELAASGANWRPLGRISRIVNFPRNVP